jgi:hypothetical protein
MYFMLQDAIRLLDIFMHVDQLDLTAGFSSSDRSEFQINRLGLLSLRGWLSLRFGLLAKLYPKLGLYVFDILTSTHKYFGQN